MKIYNTTQGLLVEFKNQFYPVDEDLDALLASDSLYDGLLLRIATAAPIQNAAELLSKHVLAPIGSQEIWASGVTYYSSREARMEESKDAGGGDFYDRVYFAERPELFFKSAPYRAVGHLQHVRIRKDSNWNVPEPELTLVVNPKGQIIGYTIGNDMSSRDIEGENPLYLPQAKSYDAAAAIGPCIWLTKEPIPLETEVRIKIERKSSVVFQGMTRLDQMKRKLPDLVSYLYREMSFPKGCLLMTGTGIVPPDNFTLHQGDVIHITIEPIGTLTNTVA